MPGMGSVVNSPPVRDRGAARFHGGNEAVPDRIAVGFAHPKAVEHRVVQAYIRNRRIVEHRAVVTGVVGMLSVACR